MLRLAAIIAVSIIHFTISQAVFSQFNVSQNYIRFIKTGLRS